LFADKLIYQNNHITTKGQKTIELSGLFPGFIAVIRDFLESLSIYSDKTFSSNPGIRENKPG
jgi:hypothetical protein